MRAAGLAVAALLFAGCAASDEVRYGEITSLSTAHVVQTPAIEQPLSIGELIVGLRAGQAQEELAQLVRTRGLLAMASAADIDLLLEAGAGPELIDAVNAVSAEIAAAVASSTAGPYITAPMMPPTTIVTPPVYVTPPLYPGYWGYPYLPWATFDFSYQYYARPPRIDPPPRPARPGPPHLRPPHVQPPHLRPPGTRPGHSQTRPPRTHPPRVWSPGTPRPGHRPGSVPGADAGQGTNETHRPGNPPRFDGNRPRFRPDEGTSGQWRSGPSGRSSPGARSSRPHAPPSQYGHERGRR